MDVGFINNITGTIMYVDESRVEWYKAAGYKLAAKSVREEPTKPVKKATIKKK